MSPFIPVFYILLLFGCMLLGLVLLAIGIVLLLKVKNKLIGGLSVAMGAVLTVFSVLIFLAQVITFRVQS